MVYDVFMFFDELDMLEIRMNVLNPVVDFFVITEADTTQMGISKEMVFKKNEHRYSEFRDKIIYNPVYNAQMEFEDQWHREIYQKNECIKGLSGCSDDDIVIFSDLDEIPNPVKVLEAIEHFDTEKIYHFAQNLYYFYINYKNIDSSLLAACGEFSNIVEKKWLGSKLCSYKKLKETGCNNLRNRECVTDNAIRIPDGGWHFSYMGGERLGIYERIRSKLAAFSHSEFNRWRYYNRLSIWLSIRLGKDLMGRDARFKKVPIDHSYPVWLQEHCKDYPHLII